MDRKLDSIIKQPVTFLGTQVEDQEGKLHAFNEMCMNIELGEQDIYRHIDLWILQSNPDEKKAFCLFLYQHTDGDNTWIIESYCKSRSIDLLGTMNETETTPENIVCLGHILVNNKAGANEFKLFNVTGKVDVDSLELTHFESRKTVYEFKPHIQCSFDTIQSWDGQYEPNNKGTNERVYYAKKRQFHDVPSNERQSFVLQKLQNPTENRIYGCIVYNGKPIEIRLSDREGDTGIVKFTTEDRTNEWYDKIKTSIPAGVELRFYNE